MKKMNKLTMAALALVALGFASTAASAQVVAGNNDVILSFQIASGTGSNTNLEVDLGSASQFTNTAVLTFNQLNVNDLTGIYSSSWADSSAGVNWSVAAEGTASDKFLLTSTTPIKTSSSSLLAAPYGQIGNLAGGLNGQAATANSPSAAAIGNNSNPASGIANSYTFLEAGTGYGYAANAEQTGAGTDELYSFAPASKVGGQFPAAGDLGTFSLSSDGVLTFNGINAAAVPEPSAYALGLCAVLLFLVLRRRQMVA
jgi:hypothetical protein